MGMHRFLEKGRGILIFFANDRAEKPLLTREESNAVKGLLTILIVLGHNRYVMEDMYCFQFLYSFHVYAFYFLPFLYNYKPERLRKVLGKNLKRLYIPYTLFFALLTGMVLWQTKKMDWGEWSLAFITGNQSNLRNALNAGGFLWFIPTMFSLLLFRQLYYRFPRLRPWLLASSLVCIVSYALAWLLPFQTYAPLSAFLGLAMLLPAQVLRYLFIRTNLPGMGMIFFTIVLGVLVIYPSKQMTAYLLLNRLVCPVCISCFLLQLRDSYASSSLLQTIGRFSFPIYLIHTLLYNLLDVVAIRYVEMNLWKGLGLFVMVLGASLLLARLKITKYFFPR